MKKTEFLERLGQELEKRNVADPADIVEEYEQHFAMKMADGYAEEEIAARLGSPASLAALWAILSQYAGSGLRRGGAPGPGHQPAVFRQDQAPSAHGGPGGPGAVRRMLRAFLCGVRPVGGQLPVLACVGLVCEVR